MPQLESSTPDPRSPVSAQPSIGRNDVISILRRRNAIFVGVCVVVYVIVLIAFMIIPVRYVATGSIIVAQQAANLDAGQPSGAEKVGDPADLESQILLVRSPRLIRTLIDRPDVRAALAEDCELRSHGLAAALSGGAKACEAALKDETALVDQLAQRYSVGAVGRSRVINISFDSSSPEVAQTLANALTNAFLEDRRKSWVALNVTSASSLKHDLDQLGQDIRRDDDKIRAFRSRNGLIRGSIAPIGSERLTGISQKLIEAETAKAEAQARLDEVLNLSSANLSQSPTVAANRIVGTLLQQINDLDNEIAKTSAVFGPRHPTMVTLENARSALQARIGAKMQSAVELERKKLETAAALADTLRKRMRTAETEAETAEDEEASIAYLVRSLESKKAKYDELSKQIARLETSAPALSDTTRLVSLAELPTSPYFPKRMPFVIGGLALALLLGAGAALLAERLDTGMRTAAAVGARSGLPTLCEVPMVTPSRWPALRRRAAPIRVLARASTDKAFQSAMSDLIAALAQHVDGIRPKIVAVASALPQDGRTVTAIALGHALALTGKRTLIVECDFLRPAMAGIFGLTETRGLAAVLRGEVGCDVAVLPTSAPNLFILPAGRHDATAAAALAGDRMAEVLAWTRHFDHVILDTPAVSDSRDACALAKYADAIVCCVRWGRSDDGRLAATVRDLTRSGGKLLGAVLTMVDLRSAALFGTTAPAHLPPLAPAGAAA